MNPEYLRAIGDYALEGARYLANNTTEIQTTATSTDSHYFGPLVALVGLGAVAFLIVRKH